MADQDYAGQGGITAPGSGHNTRALQHRIAIIDIEEVSGHLKFLI